jgi:hypothetical protein
MNIVADVMNTERALPKFPKLRRCATQAQWLSLMLCFAASVAYSKPAGDDEMMSVVDSHLPSEELLNPLWFASKGEPVSADRLTEQRANLRDTAPMVVAMAGVDVQSLYDSHVADTVSSICMTCHRNGGVAAFAQPPAQLLFTGDTVIDRQRLNYFVAKKGSERVLNKVQGINHGGGTVLDPNTTEFSLLAEYLEAAEPATPEKTFDRLLNSLQRFRGQP